MSEVRWQEKGTFIPETFEMFHSGGIKHERGLAILLDQEMTVINHVSLLKIAGKPLALNIIQIYTHQHQLVAMATCLKIWGMQRHNADSRTL